MVLVVLILYLLQSVTSFVCITILLVRPKMNSLFPFLELHGLRGCEMRIQLEGLHLKHVGIFAGAQFGSQGDLRRGHNAQLTHVGAACEVGCGGRSPRSAPGERRSGIHRTPPGAPGAATRGSWPSSPPHVGSTAFAFLDRLSTPLRRRCCQGEGRREENVLAAQSTASADRQTADPSFSLSCRRKHM